MTQYHYLSYTSLLPHFSSSYIFYTTTILLFHSSRYSPSLFYLCLLFFPVPAPLPLFALLLFTSSSPLSLSSPPFSSLTPLLSYLTPPPSYLTPLLSYLTPSPLLPGPSPLLSLCSCSLLLCACACLLCAVPACVAAVLSAAGGGREASVSPRWRDTVGIAYTRRILKSLELVESPGQPVKHVNKTENLKRRKKDVSETMCSQSNSSCCCLTCS